MDYSKQLDKLIEKQSLTENEAYQLMYEILKGKLSSEKIAALLVALRAKGETLPEVVGFVKAMREFAVRLETDLTVVDTCGTGGDGAHTFNISTTAAFIAAGAGVTVGKHGNRAVSSRSGSADILEALGIHIYISPEQVKAAVESVGIGFCFAPLYHQSMKHAVKPRQELGVRTVFNMLGPLLNPFFSRRQVIGVFAPQLTEFFANILAQLGSEHVFIIHGEDGLDEATLCARTRVTELVNGQISTRTVAPEDFGFQRVPSTALAGGDAQDNARILTDILNGIKGPKRDVAVLNAALAITCAGKAKSIEAGIQLAEEAIDSGAARQKLAALVTFSQGAMA